MFFFRILYLLCSLLVIIRGGSLPSYIDKCRMEDSPCLKTTVQKILPTISNGIPELGLPSLDPLQLSNVDFNLAGLRFHQDPGFVKGLKESRVEKVQFNRAKKIFTLEYTIDYYTSTPYTAKGKLLILPIDGNGQMTVKCKDLQFKINMPYDIKKDVAGLEFIDVKSSKFKVKANGKINFNATNLFKGNKQLSDQLLSFMNENGQEIAKEFAEPALNEYVNQLFKHMKSFFSNVPLKELFLG